MTEARHREILRVGHVLRGEQAAAFVERLKNGEAALAQLENQIQEMRAQLARKRRVMARYTRLIRFRQQREADRLAAELQEEQMEKARISEQEIAVRSAQAQMSAYRTAMTIARRDMRQVIALALARMIGGMPPDDQVAAALKGAITEVSGKRDTVLRVHPSSAWAVEAILKSGIGARWQEMFSVQPDPGLDTDALEIRAVDGTTTLTLARQVALLTEALGAHGGDRRDPVRE